MPNERTVAHPTALCGRQHTDAAVPSVVDQLPCQLDRAAGLELVRIARVAAEVGQRHPQRPVLHLPDMAELVGDEVVARALERLAEDDRVPGGVTVEAVEPREAKEPGPDENSYPVDPHRSRVEGEPVEPGLRPLERLPCRRVQAQLAGRSESTGLPS